MLAAIQTEIPSRRYGDLQPASSAASLICPVRAEDPLRPTRNPVSVSVGGQERPVSCLCRLQMFVVYSLTFLSG